MGDIRIAYEEMVRIQAKELAIEADAVSLGLSLAYGAKGAKESVDRIRELGKGRVPNEDSKRKAENIALKAWVLGLANSPDAKVEPWPVKS